MIRGTTPTHIFNLPFDTSLLKIVKISYAQDGVLVLQKHNSDCVLEGNTVKTTLTQEDTFLFEYNKNVQIQIRVLTNDGKALAGQIQTVAPMMNLDDEVLV